MLLLPSIFLLLLGLGLSIRHRFRPDLGRSWLAAVLGVLLVWVLLLVFRGIDLPPVTLGNWLSSHSPYSLDFQMDDPSWIYAFSLVSVVLGVLMTAAARQIVQNTPYNWVRSIVLAGLGLLAIFAANPVSLVLAWTAIDMSELGLLLSAISNRRLSQRIVLAFSARVGGSLLLLWAAIASRNLGQTLTLGQADTQISMFVLLAAGLRLGVLPLHLPYAEEVPVRRGWGTALRMVSTSTSLVVLARLPSNAVPPEASAYLLLFSALAALYGAVMWLSTDEIRGRPYWLIALAGMAIGCVIRGYPQASLAWGVALMLPGTMLFLYSARTPLLLYVMLFGLVSLSGLPFTPTASGWAGLVIPPFNLPDIVFMIAYAMIQVGYLRHIFRPGEPLTDMDRWMQTVYPFGILLLILSTWLTVILRPEALTLGNWWASLITAMMVGAGWFFFRRYQTRIEENTPAWWKSSLVRRLAGSLAGFFRLDWLYRLLWAAYRGAQRFMSTLRLLLEGDGGMLWTLVLLALLVILLQAGGTS